MSVLFLQKVGGEAGVPFQVPVALSSTGRRSIAGVLAVALLLGASAEASEFSGKWAVVKIGNNANSPATASTSNAIYPAVEAGYGWDVEGALLGVNANWDSHPQSITGTDYGFEMKLGVPKNKWLPYGKLGLALSSPGVRTQGGFGVEYKFKPQWSVSGEWQVDSKHVGGVDQRNSNFTVGFTFYFDQPKLLPVVAATPQPVVVAPVPVATVVVEPVIAPEPVHVVEVASVATLGAVPVVVPVAVPDVVAPPVVEVAVILPPASVKEELPQSVAQGKPFTMSGEASFTKGSAKLLKSAMKRLDEVVKYAKLENKAGHIEISGHSDSIGSAQGNLKLSSKRAEAVKSYFTKQGVKANRITAKGFGADKPIADNASETGRIANRRVEIRFVDAQ
jgi:outer membrane protein OmpA-like peptidoglycan-associated protein